MCCRCPSSTTLHASGVVLLVNFNCRGAYSHARSSHKSVLHLCHPSCQRDPNWCPSILCKLDWFACLAFRRASPYRAILSSLSRRGVCPSFCFLFLPLPSLPWSCLCTVHLAFVSFARASALAGFAFASVVRARPSTCLVLLRVFSVLPTISFHVSIADKSIVTGLASPRANSTFSICFAITKCTALQTLDDHPDFRHAPRCGSSLKICQRVTTEWCCRQVHQLRDRRGHTSASVRSPLNDVASKSTSFETVVTVFIF